MTPEMRECPPQNSTAIHSTAPPDAAKDLFPVLMRLLLEGKKKA